MRRNRMFIVLLVIVTVMAMAAAAMAAPPAGKGPPDKPPKPEPPPIWTCAERVQNGAVWVPGEWNGTSYESVFPQEEFEVDVPLCIDINEEHWTVTHWTVKWTGTARKAPKSLMFIFEEELPAAHYAELEMPRTAGDDITSGEELMILDFEKDDDDPVNVEHLVFLAMGRHADKWTDLKFWVTPHLEPPD